MGVCPSMMRMIIKNPRFVPSPLYSLGVKNRLLTCDCDYVYRLLGVQHKQHIVRAVQTSLRSLFKRRVQIPLLQSLSHHRLHNVIKVHHLPHLLENHFPLSVRYQRHRPMKKNWLSGSRRLSLISHFYQKSSILACLRLGSH